jgi:ADP-heptose:LPS heptosyltransferase
MLPGLGDLLCAVPAMAGLRSALPSAEMTFIGRRSSRWFADRYPGLIDDWIGCDWCPGLVESTVDPGALAATLTDVRTRHVEVAIQLHGDGRLTNAFTAALGAPLWGGLARRCGDHLRTVGEGTHEIDRCVEAVRAVGLTIEPHPMTMRLLPTDLVPRAVPSRSYAVVHAGASRPERRWPAEAFATAARRLLDHVDHVVLTGVAGEGDIVGAVHDAIAPVDGNHVIDLHGRTSIGSLAALLASARVVVSNDTGVAHLSAAVAAPTVTIFGTPDRARWEPPGAQCLGGADGWPEVDEVVAAAEAVLDGRTLC